jgi:two-component system nitrate/nitrite response regulator NarL
MPNIGLLLRSPLMNDALSVLLTEAGFCVIREPKLPDDDATVVIDFDDCLDLEKIGAYQRRGAKVVVLAREADSLAMSGDQIALLSGLLTYDLSADAFARSLGLICSGERVFPRNLALDQNRPARPSGNEVRGRDVRLSPREVEVLLLLVEGHSNKAIARILGVTETTVKIHLKNVFRKIKADSRTQAAIWALSNLPELRDTARALSAPEPEIRQFKSAG